MKQRNFYLAIVIIYAIATLIGYLHFMGEINNQKDVIAIFNEGIVTTEKKIDSIKKLKQYCLEIDSLLNLTEKQHTTLPDSSVSTPREAIKAQELKAKQYDSIAQRKKLREITKQKAKDSLEKLGRQIEFDKQREKDSLGALESLKHKENNVKRSSKKIMGLNSINKSIPISSKTTIFDIKYDPNNGKLVNSIGTDIPKKVLINGIQVIIRSTTEFYYENNKIAFYRIRVQLGENILKKGTNELIITDNLARKHIAYFSLNN